MVEDYAVGLNVFRGVPTGQYKKNRLGNDIAIYEYHVEYETPLGKMIDTEWKERLLAEVDKEHMKEHLEIIKEHCRKNCAWLKNETDILDYSLRILANGSYKCGNKLWDDVVEKINALNTNK